jgi:Bacterial Ig domain/Chitobiase/beta-hexosaminidase C-terminal domain/Bacterial Ig-like domain/PASTA domain
MANFPELRPGERSAEAERVAVLRSASPVRLAALAACAAAIFMAILQVGGQSNAEGAPPFLTEALGAYAADAPLVRHPAPGVVLAIEDSSFQIRSSDATVTLATQGAGAGDWHRFENGVSRPIAEGAETILVDGPTLEQFLTVRERQGLRTWSWRIDTAQVPRVGDDGAVAFLDAKLHKLTDVSIAPVAILDAEGKDVTPKGLRWNVEQRNGGWWLTLRLNDSELLLPYVIDPAVTHRNTQINTATGATSVTVTKPTGVQANDLLVAHVMVTGNVTGSIAAPAGWTTIVTGTAANAATQASFYKIAGGSEAANSAFTWTGSQVAAASVSAYYGVKASSVFDFNSTVASTNNTTTVTANGVTTTANDDLVLAFFGSVSNSTYTPPVGWNERADAGTTGISGSMADEIKATAGATGNVTATSTVSARVYGHQAAFKVDNVAPSVTMSDPGSPVTGTITLQTSSASDTDSYVAQVQFQRSPAGAGLWTNVGSADTTSPYSVSFDTSTVSDGLYDVRAVATDGAGNTANSATISNRQLDNNAPSSTTTFPASGGSYKASNWNSGCGTNGFCGTYSDAASGSGVQKVEISIRRNTGNYWNGSSFGSGSEVWDTTSLSGGDWSYTFPESSFPADDTYTIRVRATDNVNLAETPNSRSFTYDTAAPDTSITANPADPTQSTSASFSFTSTEGSSTFECQLDGGGYSSCTSPKSYGGPLSDGSHTFFVRATDPAGNTDGSAASYTWSVDTAAPSSTVSFPGSGSSYNASGWNAGCATNGYCGTYSDATSGVQKVEISIRQGAGNYWSAGSFGSGSEVWNTTSLSAGNWSYTFPASNFPADGIYTIRAKATDNAGNAESPSSRSFTIDRSAPDTTIDSNPSNPSTSANASFSFSSTEGGSTFECQIDGGGYSSCTSPKSYTGLSEGSHTFLVRATDLAGNTDGSAASYTWTVDTVAPSSTTTFPASAASYNTSGWNAGCATAGLCGTYSDATTGVQKVEISIRQGSGNYWNGSSFGSPSEAFQTATIGGGNWSYGFSAASFPAGGSYTVHVRATDNAGNTESGPSRTFTYDTTPPETTIDSNPSDPSTSANATFTFSADEGGSTFQCDLDGAGFSSCSSPKSYSLSDGSHTFKVKATDPAGNSDASPAQHTWTIDTTAPSSTTSFPASGTAYNASAWNAGCATAGLCGTYSDATTGVQKVEISIRQGSGNYWNGSGFSSGSEVWNTTSLSGGNWSYAFATTDFPADGTYTIRVKATDNAGNGETPASRSFTYDTADPSALFSFPASGGDYTNAAWNAGCATVGFCGTYSDATSGVQTVEISFRRGSGNYWNGTSFGSGSEVFQTASLSGGNWSYAFSAASFPADGAYTVHVRASDNASNTESGPSRIFRIDNTNPSALFSFPASGGAYSASGWNAGCGTNGFCGTYSDATSGVQAVDISIQRVSTGLHWNGTAFSSGAEDFQAASFSGGNWSYAFPASSFPADGSYAVHVRAHDNAGNTETGPSRSFTIDNVAPNTTVDSGPSNPSASADATFSFSATEGGSTFECELDGGGFSACSSPKSYTSLSDGSHTFNVRAADTAGNTDATPAQSAWSVDTAAPSSTVSFPGAGAFYRTSTWNLGCATSGVCGTYSDATSGVQKVEVSIRRIGTGLYWDGSAFSSGSEQFFTSSLSAGSWSYAFGAANFPADDDYTVRVKATDNAGNAESPSSRTFTFDATAPTGSLTAPTNGAVVSGSSVTISSDSADAGSGVALATFERRPSGGGSWTTIDSDSSAPYAASWDTTAIGDGDYDLRVTTDDHSGNSFTSTTRTVTVDNTAPSSANLDALPGAVRNGQALTGSGADAGSGVASLSYYYCAGPPCSPSTLIGSSTTGPTYSVTWSSQPADGDYQVLVRVADRSGNTLDSAKQTVIVDNADPTGSLTAPANGVQVSGTVAVSSDSADAGSGVARAAFERRPSGGGSWTTLATDTSAPYSVNWDTTPLGDGDYDLRVVTTDAAGNSFTSAARTVSVDNHAPTVSITTPSAYVNGAAADPFTVTASSSDTDIASVEFFVCSNANSGCSSGSWNSLGAPDTTAPYTASWDVQGDGNQTLRAVITDNASNTGSDVVNTLVDRTDPSGSVTSPSGGAFLSSTVSVSSDSADSGSGVASALFERRPAGGGAWTAIGTDTSAPYSVSWDTSALNGDFDLHVVTTDTAGNSQASAAVTVTVDNSAPSTPVISLSESSSYAFVSGQTVFVNAGQSGSYDVSATSSDAQSGIERIRFPGPVDDSSSPYGTTYGFGDLSGSQTVTAYNNAGLSASDTFTVTSDTTAPATTDDTGTIGSAWRNTPVTVTLNPSDSGAGVAATYYTTDGSTPTTSSSQGTSVDLTSNGVYTIKYFSVDRVGNAEAVKTAGTQIRVDLTNPSAPALTLSESSAFAHVIDTTVYVKSGQTGTYTVAATSSDPLSGINKMRFPGGVDDTVSPYQTIYALDDLTGTQTVTAYDNAGNSSSSDFDVTADDVAPSGGSVSYTDGYDADGQIPVSTSNGTDALSDVDASTGILERRTSALTDGTCAGFSGGWTPVSSPDTVATDTCAQYRYRVSDHVSNEVVYTSANVVKVDQTAPNTSIGSTPSDPTNATGAAFTFSATETGSTFECELDGGGFSSCASPKSYSGLADGSHTFEVRATDQAGNTDAAPASYTWAVNAGAPSVSITAPAGFVNLADADPFAVTATSPDAEVASVEFFSCTDASSDCSTGSWVSLGTDATAPYTASWPLPADGNTALRAVATDVGSNTGEDIVDVTVDRTRPVTSIDSAPADPTNTTGATFDFSASEGGASFQCRLEGGSFAACSSPKSYSSLAEGAHTFDVQATDAAGNPEASPQTYTWTVDTTAPDTSITATPSDPISSSSADFTFTSTEGSSTLECRLDGGSFASCASPASYSGLADGSHTFRVRATDAAGNTDSSAAVFTWTVDSTAPGGGLADPGSPLRGTVGLSASPSDTGVGIQQVVFQSSPADAGTWSPIGTDTTAPYTASWDTTGVADGLYDLRIVVTDNASNTFASTVVEDRLVDNTNPTAVMNDPGANLSGTVNLTSTTSDAGSGVAAVTYQRSPAGAGTWTNVPAAWNTASVADGLYDLRVRVTDNAGNVTTSASVDDRWVDNTAPTLTSSAPFDGSKVAAAGSLSVTANEDLADVAGSDIDGSAVGGVVSGSTVTFAQAFAEGPHTLSGELEDLAGNRTPIRVHFTVWNTTGGDYPYIEKNSFASSAMTVAITNGNGQLHIPAGAWSGAPVGDWLVARVDPRPAGAVSTGFAAQGDIYDVSAYWALAGGAVTSFDEPIDLTLMNGAGNVVPAVLNGSAWQPIARLSGTSLPGGTQRGFYKDGDTVHLLTRESGTFTLLRDLAAPSKPKGFKGKNAAGRLALSWKASADNSGLVDAYLVYVNGTVSRTVPGSQLSADMGVFSQRDARFFQVAARDAAGNVSGKTVTLVVVPKVTKLPLAKAKSALSKRGLKAGKITYVFSSIPKGSVISAGKTGLVPRGSAVPLKVSKGLARESYPGDTTGPQAYEPPAYQPPSSPPPTSPPPMSAPPTDSPPTGGEPVASEAAGAGAAEPESFNRSQVSSARRTAGLILLASLFLGAGAMALRARRRLMAPLPNAENLDGPILFWDERLVRGTASAVRRAFAILGR